jgi:hypothetical protein
VEEIPLARLDPLLPQIGAQLSAIGSGTFVEIAGQHHVLMAAHVWAAVEPFDNIGFRHASLVSGASGVLIWR